MSSASGHGKMCRRSTCGQNGRPTPMSPARPPRPGSVHLWRARRPVSAVRHRACVFPDCHAIVGYTVDPGQLARRHSNKNAAMPEERIKLLKIFLFERIFLERIFFNAFFLKINFLNFI